MPKRTDIQKIMIIGAGPIIIGQACEFDYSGAQACKALKEEGYTVVLVNSNPATIMTDPSMADRTYVEPLTVDVLEKIIEKERPDALLPTVGGQTGLNLSIDLSKQGILAKYNVEMIGANEQSIHKAEARDEFKKAMDAIGLESALSEVAYTLDEAKQAAKNLGYPCVVRPAFTLGGTGGGIVKNEAELEEIAKEGLASSLITEVLIEESIVGWKEYELEVMRDKNDNVVIVCAIENLDPMGIHTGDSITVAPAQTLTDREYQMMRDASIAIMREIGVETGGSNVQFALNPKDGRLIVIEMNPRVSRSSALASKATGFPIAKFAAKLAVGFTLDELQNDITKETPACFEPTLDYCVIKIPRFNFDKFSNSPARLGTSMKSVGEAMAIGRTFKEALQKGLRSLETKRYGFGFDGKCFKDLDLAFIKEKLADTVPDRLFYIKAALESGMSVDDVYDICFVDKWFLHQFQQIIDEANLPFEFSEPAIRRKKELGFSDFQLAILSGEETEEAFREKRKSLNVIPTYSLVDTCAAEFEAYTPYYYSTYETENESVPSDKEKVMILGGGPNRIGQGIEFDYCCVHSSYACRDEGFESIMVNSNPETVSTDFDTSDKLYFEPLTFEDVMNIYELEKPKGVIVQFGGQTPLNLSVRLEKAGAKLLGTSSDSIDRAEDRDRFKELLETLNLRQPPNGTVTSLEEATAMAETVGYPVVVRPSYVIGGTSMRIVYQPEELVDYMSNAIDVSPDHPILIDKYLSNAVELDVDSLSDGTDCVVAGIMQHIEEAGIHSGDSACVFPPHSLSDDILDKIRKATTALALELKVIGLMNIQFAVKDEEIYVLEVNPRASRTIPFISKATGTPWAQLATKVMLGQTVKDLKVTENMPKHYAVKESVFPFSRFPGVDIILGPEMKSTGEVMGIDDNFEMAFLKAQLGAGSLVPKSGKVMITVKDLDKERILPVVAHLVRIGFEICATSGTADYLSRNGIQAETVNKISEGSVHTIDLIQSGDLHLIINTANAVAKEDQRLMRAAALKRKIPIVTTIPGAEATASAIEAYNSNAISVKALQDFYSTEPKTRA